MQNRNNGNVWNDFAADEVIVDLPEKESHRVSRTDAKFTHPEID